MTPQQKIVDEKMASAKEYAENMLLKANNQSEKFLNHQPMCRLCLGTGNRIIYEYGRRFAKRCEGAIWDPAKKRLICSGISNWKDLEQKNKYDLASQIWKIVSKQRLKIPFMIFLREDYQTQILRNLLTQQLDTILSMLHSGRLITYLTAIEISIPKTKAA